MVDIHYAGRVENRQLFSAFPETLIAGCLRLPLSARE
jgi:hypothetical protein